MSAAMIHNVAHIELNAIDLAWDTVARFSRLAAADDAGAADAGTVPTEFFADFARVADDESRHLGWCLQRLGEMGVRYGDIPAHNVLWEGAAGHRVVVAREAGGGPVHAGGAGPGRGSSAGRQAAGPRG